MIMHAILHAGPYSGSSAPAKRPSTGTPTHHPSSLSSTQLLLNAYQNIHGTLASNQVTVLGSEGGVELRSFGPVHDKGPNQMREQQANNRSE
jgi:hypothetical protein